MDSATKYKNYDFFADENWRTYSTNIFPPPARSQLEKIRRKWYQANIDPSFDPKFDVNPNEPNQEENSATEEPQTQNLPEENKTDSINKQDPKSNEKTATKEQPNEQTPKPHQHSANCGHSHAEKLPQQQIKSVSFLTNSLFTIEAFLKLNFLVSIVILQDFANWIALLICILALIRQCKRPRWNKEYAEKIVYNEYFHNIWYMVPFFLFQRQSNIIYFAPLAIHVWIGVCEYINLKGGKILEILKGPVEKTRTKRVYLMGLKQKIEIFMFFYLIILMFVSQTNLMVIILYSNYLRIKYVVNRNLMMTCYEIDLWIRTNIVKETSPKILKWVYGKIVQFCSYMVTPNAIKKTEEKKEEQKTN